MWMVYGGISSEWLLTRHLGVDDLDWVIHSCPDQDIRNKLDELFTSWVGHLVRGERSSSGNPRAALNADNPNRELDHRRRRRALYSTLQHLYGRKPSACAHEVLDGTWENPEPSTAPSLEQFWKTWQPIFETPSIKDNRRPTCVGQVKWEIVALVIPTELQQVLSEGVSSAPGPDGVKLKDVIGLGQSIENEHFGHSSQNISCHAYRITHVITIIAASQLHFLANKNTDLAVCSQ